MNAAATVVALWDNRNGAARSGNSVQRLTPTRYQREEAGMNATAGHAPRSPRWLGAISDYQAEARLAFVAHNGPTEFLPWTWMVAMCGDVRCIAGECLRLHSPVKIAYAPGVCVYCGDVAGTRDHLLPEPWTGHAARLRVAVVPACGDCNGRINDNLLTSVTARRAHVHKALRKRHAKLLKSPTWTGPELDELGKSLRSAVDTLQAQKQHVLARLDWPIEADYDLAAFQRSGIEDPYALGVITRDERAFAPVPF